MADKDSKPTKGKQVQHGKAFEYCVAVELAKAAQAELIKDAENIKDNNFYKSLSKISQKKMGVEAKAADTCLGHYETLSKELQARMDMAAKEAIQFLSRYERNRMAIGNSVIIQPDQAGKEGDVRDVLLCQNRKPLFGISAKHRHRSFKHPRLSNTIDFGKEWGKFSVSPSYWEKVRNIFDDLEQRKIASGSQVLFRDIPNLQQTVLLPVLTAFETELKSLIEEHGKPFCRNLFSYLVGNKDYYQIVADKEKVTVTSFKLRGNLKWGKKWTIPKLAKVERDEKNDSTTLHITFDRIWTFSLRLHNARSRIEPSLKFDVKLVGMSPEVHHTHLPFPSS